MLLSCIISELPADKGYFCGEILTQWYLFCFQGFPNFCSLSGVWLQNCSISWIVPCTVESRDTRIWTAITTDGAERKNARVFTRERARVTKNKQMSDQNGGIGSSPLWRKRFKDNLHRTTEFFSDRFSSYWKNKRSNWRNGTRECPYWY